MVVLPAPVLVPVLPPELDPLAPPVAPLVPLVPMTDPVELEPAVELAPDDVPEAPSEEPVEATDPVVSLAAPVDEATPAELALLGSSPVELEAVTASDCTQARNIVRTLQQTSRMRNLGRRYRLVNDRPWGVGAAVRLTSGLAEESGAKSCDTSGEEKTLLGGKVLSREF